MAKVLGIGGIFYKAADPAAVREWYARVLGFEINDWGGASFDGAPGSQQWSIFNGDTTYFAPSEQGFMVNLVVDDLDALTARAAAAGADILDQQSDQFGKFAWLIDPAGVKVELWQPAEDAG